MHPIFHHLLTDFPVRQLKYKYQFGTPPDGLEAGSPEDYGDESYIYESPDKGKTVYRRKFNDYDTPREQVDTNGNPYPKQLGLFD